MLPNLRSTPPQHNFKDLLSGLVVGAFFWPICIILYSINTTLRYLAQTAYDHFYPGKYKICDGEDGVFGTKVKGNCNSLIQGYQIIKGKPDVNRIREKFTSMLENTGEDYSRFKYVFTDKFGFYCWKKDDNFAIHKHIRLLETWDPNREVDERKILDITADLVIEPMASTKPQWEILVFPKYRMEDQKSSDPCDHYVIFTRFNHAYSDAISYFLMVNKYLADAPAELPMDPTKPFKVPVWAQAFVWAKVFILGPLNFLGIMVTYILDQSVYRASYYSESKLVARSPEIQLDTLKGIKKASGASVTAVLFTAVYSALYKSHLKLYPHEKVPQVLHLGNVMAMFPYWQKRKLGNQFTLWPYSAPLKIDSLEERLKVTHVLTQRGMGSPDPVFDFYMTRCLGSLPKICHNILWSLSGSPIMLSNVPGFSTRLKLYGGEMVDGAGFIPLMSTTGVGISTQTLCGALRFNAVVDPKVFPRRSDLQNFLNDVITDLRELAKIYNVSEEDCKNEAVTTCNLTEDENNNNILTQVDLMNLNLKSLVPVELVENSDDLLESTEQESDSNFIVNPRVRRILDKESDDPSEADLLRKAADDFKSSRKYFVKTLL